MTRAAYVCAGEARAELPDLAKVTTRSARRTNPGRAGAATRATLPISLAPFSLTWGELAALNLVPIWLAARRGAASARAPADRAAVRRARRSMALQRAVARCAGGFPGQSRDQLQGRVYVSYKLYRVQHRKAGASGVARGCLRNGRVPLRAPAHKPSLAPARGTITTTCSPPA